MLGNFFQVFLQKNKKKAEKKRRSGSAHASREGCCVPRAIAVQTATPSLKKSREENMSKFRSCETLQHIKLGQWNTQVEAGLPLGTSSDERISSPKKNKNLSTFTESVTAAGTPFGGKVLQTSNFSPRPPRRHNDPCGGSRELSPSGRPQQAPPAKRR